MRFGKDQRADRNHYSNDYLLRSQVEFWIFANSGKENTHDYCCQVTQFIPDYPYRIGNIIKRKIKSGNVNCVEHTQTDSLC